MKKEQFEIFYYIKSVQCGLWLLDDKYRSCSKHTITPGDYFLWVYVKDAVYVLYQQLWTICEHHHFFYVYETSLDIA